MNHANLTPPLADKDESSPATASASDSDREDPPTIQASTPIVYHYLTFDRQLPHPLHLAAIDNLPPPPDLAPYDNPFDWPDSRKNVLIALCCVSTLFTAYCAGMYAPGVPQMMREWGIGRVAALVGITIFTAGEFFSPIPMRQGKPLINRFAVQASPSRQWSSRRSARSTVGGLCSYSAGSRLSSSSCSAA